MGSCCTRQSNLVHNPDPVSEAYIDRNFTYKKIQTNINIIPASPERNSINDESHSEPASFISIQRQPRSSTVKHLNLVDRVRSGQSSIRSSHSSQSHKSLRSNMSHSKFPNHKSTSPANESESDSENSSMFSFCSRLDFSHSFCKDESGFSRSSNRSPTVPVTNTIKKAKSFQGKTKVNQYTLDLLLGRGAFGRVFKGVDDRGQAFAIKVYNKKVLRSKWIGKRKTAMDCVKTEIEVMQTLDHQNIIKLIEVIDMETSKKIYLILELVEGGNLQKKCPMDELSAKSYFKSLLTAIDYLHNKKQIVHRDIKPQNLLISKTNSLKVCDFGAAQFLSDENDELNNSAGTFMFMPPEAHKTGSFRGRPADIWACGITLYYMVIGRSPFEKKSYSALLQEMSENELKIPEKLSDDLKDLIRKMTCLEPEDRIDAESILSHSWLIC